MKILIYGKIHHVSSVDGNTVFAGNKTLSCYSKVMQEFIQFVNDMLLLCFLH